MTLQQVPDANPETHLPSRFNDLDNQSGPIVHSRHNTDDGSGVRRSVQRGRDGHPTSTLSDNVLLVKKQLDGPRNLFKR